MRKILLTFRHAALYRKSIYEAIDRTFDAEFVFSKKPEAQLKMMDTSVLKHVKCSLRECLLPGGFYYLKGMPGLNLRPFDNVVFAGDIRDISSWILLIKCRFFHKKSCLWTHGWYGKETFWIRWIKKCYYGLADVILLYGNHARNLMIKAGISDVKIHVIYNSLDYDTIIANRRFLEKSNNSHHFFKNKLPELLYIGRLTKEKKLHQLIEALQLLITNGTACNVLFIGDGSEYAILNELVKKYDIQEYVHFYGSCYDDRILSEIIFNADICVSPGNVGLTAIHALGYGTPVITNDDFSTQMPEFESISKGVNGDFFRADSSESLAQVINRWIIDHPIKSNELVEKCFKVVDEKYNPYYQLAILKIIFND